MSKETVKDVERTIRVFMHTMTVAQSREGVAESVERIDIVLLIGIMILSFPPKSLDVPIWSCKKITTDSTERQFWSCMASGCLSSVIPVFFSYVCNADSKSARK